MPLRPFLRPGLALALAGFASGCVTIYQPLTSLQRPAVIDPAVENFKGLHLMVRCIPTEYTDDGDSQILCENLKTLFTTQGAEVEVQVPESDLPPREDDAKRPDLVIELSSHQVHSENSALQWTLCYASATLIPAVTEATFSQTVTLRDADGFLLGQDVQQARFVRYFGLGYWAINGIMDLLVRPPEEKLLGGAAKTDFSRDFYGQLSQLTFHARMRQMVLRSFDPGLSVLPVNNTPAAAPSAAPATSLGKPAAPVAVPPPLPLPKGAADKQKDWDLPGFESTTPKSAVPPSGPKK